MPISSWLANATARSKLTFGLVFRRFRIKKNILIIFTFFKADKILVLLYERDIVHITLFVHALLLHAYMRVYNIINAVN